MLGAEPDDQDVADYLGVSLEDYHGLLVDAQSRFTLSLYENAEDQQPVLETVALEDAMDAFDQIDRNSMHEYVERLVAQLPEREQQILALYYYENLTLREIGQIIITRPSTLRLEFQGACSVDKIKKGQLRPLVHRRTKSALLQQSLPHISCQLF